MSWHLVLSIAGNLLACSRLDHSAVTFLMFTTTGLPTWEQAASDDFQLGIIAGIPTSDTCGDEQCGYCDGPNTNPEPELLLVQGYEVHSLQ